MTPESGNFSEDANFLPTPFETYGTPAISGGEVSELNTISFLERLEIEDFEIPHLSNGTTSLRMSEAWLLRRVEPFGPVDYLEYYHRIN
jgi:hypothetical protein